MGEPTTPRGVIKALLRGEAPSRPLLLPIIFSLGSRLENLALRDFYSNPTKIANALRQIHSVLKVDGVACYFDPFLEAEALGCKLDWLPDGTRRLVPPPFSDVDDLRQKLKSPDSICEKGRIRVACDVLQRLKAMLKDEPALMVRLTGPLTLAAQLSNLDDQNSRPSLPSGLIEFVAEVTACVAKEFVVSGADVVLLTEDSFPELPVESYEQWAALLEPVINLIRFYDCLPALMLNAPARGRSVLPGLLKSDGCLVSSLENPAAEPKSWNWQSITSVFGIALPSDLFVGRDDDGRLMSSVCVGLRDLKPVLLTSAADLPTTADLKHVGVVLKSLREEGSGAEHG
ncbi:MAG: uroporphyrinogen decarboxylase family protein [Acidobacteriia bacterium]|nr:uroporphyrinogen decarboxylase family protein [Terriglobia bacterium]